MEFAIGNDTEGFKEFKLVMTDMAISLHYKNIQFTGLASHNCSIKQETVQEECVQDDLGFIHHA